MSSRASVMMRPRVRTTRRWRDEEKTSLEVTFISLQTWLMIFWMVMGLADDFEVLLKSWLRSVWPTGSSGVGAVWG